MYKCCKNNSSRWVNSSRVDHTKWQTVCKYNVVGQLTSRKYKPARQNDQSLKHIKTVALSSSERLQIFLIALVTFEVQRMKCNVPSRRKNNAKGWIKVRSSFFDERIVNICWKKSPGKKASLGCIDAPSLRTADVFPVFSLLSLQKKKRTGSYK